MTACGLSRLGYTVLILSPRLSPTAYQALLAETDCQSLFCTPQTVQNLSQIPSQVSIHSLLYEDEILSLNTTQLPGFETAKTELSDRELVAYIMHSSGSTGLPKPIYQTHQRYISNAANGMGRTAFATLPLYHAYGFGLFYSSLSNSTLLILHDFSVPVTGSCVTAVVERMRPQQVCTVPYTLKLISEVEGGVEALKRCELVTYHGSSCPVELGDCLSAKGVHLVGHLGRYGCQSVN